MRIFILGLALFSLVACDTQSTPHIRLLYPQPVEQGERLTLYGEGFGAYAGSVSIRFGTHCADPIFWEDDRVGIRIPKGIGTGVKQLRIVLADGTLLTTDVVISGEDQIPTTRPACQPGLVTVNDVSNEPLDVSNPPDTPQPDTFEPSDAPPTDGFTLPNGYRSQRAAILHAIRIPRVRNGITSCCRDFGDISQNGTGMVDNAYAALSDTLTGFGLDLEEQYQNFTETGSLVWLLDFTRWNNTPNDASLVLNTFTEGEFGPGTTSENFDGGNASFLLSPSQFSGNDPLNSHAIGLEDSVITPARLPQPLTLPLSLLVDAPLLVPLQEAQIVTRIQAEGDGVLFPPAQISGYVNVTDAFDALNTLARERCSCLESPLFFLDSPSGQWVSACPADVQAVCPGDRLCQQLGGSDIGTAQICGLVPTLLPALADIDTDGNTANGFEAFSVGLHAEGTPAIISGIAAP